MLGRTLRNLGWLLGSRAVNALFSLIYLAVATRTLGLTGFGQFSLIIVLAQGVTGLASFSTWQGVVHWGREPVDRAKAAGFALALDGVSIAGGGVVAALTVWSAPHWLPLEPSLRPAAFGLCMATLIAIRSTPTGLLRLQGRYDLATAAEAVQPGTRAAGALLAAWSSPTIAGFVSAWAAAELACAAAYWVLAWRLQHFERKDVNLRDIPARDPAAWDFVWSTNLSRSLAVVAKQGVVLLVGAFGGAALAGIYRVAAQLGQALVQLGEAVSRAVYPEFVRDLAASRQLSRRITRLSLMTGALAVGMAVVGGDDALQLLAGPAFVSGYTALIVLTVGGALELLVAGWDALLVANGNALTSLIYRAVALAIGLILLPFALQDSGAWGAACCLAASSAIASLALSRKARAIMPRNGSVPLA